MEISPVVLSVCAISLVMVALVFLAAILLLRVTKHSIFGFAMMFLRMFTETKDEPSSLPVQAKAQSVQRRDLRAAVQSSDFDAAVAKYGGDQNQVSAQSLRPGPKAVLPNTPVAPQAAPPDPFDMPPPSLADRRRKRRHIEDNDDEADVLESFLGE